MLILEKKMKLPLLDCQDRNRIAFQNGMDEVPILFNRRICVVSFEAHYYYVHFIPSFCIH